MAGSVVQTVNAVAAASAQTISAASMNVTAGNLLFMFGGGKDFNWGSAWDNSSGTSTRVNPNQANSAFNTTINHGWALITFRVSVSGTWVPSLTMIDNGDQPFSASERNIYAGEITGVDATQTPDFYMVAPSIVSDPTSAETLAISAANDPAFVLVAIHDIQSTGTGVYTGWTAQDEIDWSSVTGELFSQKKTSQAQGNLSVQFENNSLSHTLHGGFAIKEGSGGGSSTALAAWLRG